MGPGCDRMDTLMCRGATGRALARAGLGLLLATAAAAQTAPAPVRPDWRPIGGTTVEVMLASPATGPVESVWFSPDGDRLYARTRSGRVFETTDFEAWTPSAAAKPPGMETPAPPERLPGTNARLVPDPERPGRLYALAGNLYRTDDDGRTWANLTAYRDRPVIGSGERDLAVSPRNPDELVVANDFGVWRTVDGGLSWTGLNEGLPNLPVRRILAAPGGTAGTRIWLDELGAAEFVPGSTSQWQAVADDRVREEADTRAVYSRAAGAEITAFAASGDTVYAGASDGRLFVSTDRGRSWTLSPAPGAGAVAMLWVDPQEPRLALAALTGRGPRVLRTVNGGAFWDDLTLNLPEGDAHAVIADRASGTIYTAADRGVFFTRADLYGGSPAAPWMPLTGNLPAAKAVDVKLNAAGNQLYIALEGYGVYAAAAPHRAGRLRWLNAADFSTRPAAPGSLLSVLGGRVERATGAGLNFPVLAASDSEAQIQVPFEVSGPGVDLALESSLGRTTLGLPIRNVSPAIFVDPDGQPMLLDGDSGVMLSAGNMARSNSRVQILATGLGRVRPDWPTGLAAPLDSPPQVVAPLAAYLDRAPVAVTRATLAPGYIGFYLVEVQLPALVNAGPAELYLVAGEQESNRVRIYLEP